MARSSKMAGCRVTRSEIWYSGVVVISICDTFDLVVFNSILGFFGALVSKWPVTQKRLAVEQNGLKFRTKVICGMYILWGSFDLLVFRFILSSFSVFVPKWPVTKKRLSVEENVLKFGSRG